MGRKKNPCKNHPERSSARKCYQCKTSICPECQHHYFHHLFCGYWCTGRYWLFEIVLKKRQYREYAILLAIIFISQILLIFLFLPAKDQGAEQAAEEKDSALLHGERRISPLESNMTLDTIYSQPTHALQISGKGPANTLFGLWQNGKFRSATVSNGGSYQFPNQVLSLGMNTFLVWALSDQGITSLIDSFSVTFNSRRLTYLATPFDKATTNRKIVALTFDGGSLAAGADSILSILTYKQVRSTFFLTGTFIRNFPGIVKQLVDSDHELANHTYSHPHLTSFETDGKQTTKSTIDRDVLVQQLTKTDSLLYAKVNVHFKPYWRAPFGEYNRTILIWAAEVGYKHIGWSQGGDTRDWVADEDSPLYRSAQEIYEYLLDMESRGKLKGSVILMHLHSDRPDQKPYKILPDLIDELQNRGYQLMTISELIQAASAT